MKVFDNHTQSQLIGIAGPFCSGKDTAAVHLVKERGFMHVSTGDVLRAEAAKQGRDYERSTLIDISVELRREYGSVRALVVKAIEQWEKHHEKFRGGLVISGLRVVGEAQEIQRQNGTLVFIDAPAEIRYKRAKERAKKEDRVIELVGVHNLKEFIESERVELEGLGGPERPYIRGVETIADVVILNNSTEKEFLSTLSKSLKLAAY